MTFRRVMSPYTRWALYPHAVMSGKTISANLSRRTPPGPAMVPTRQSELGAASSDGRAHGVRDAGVPRGFLDGFEDEVV